jgi:bacterioferritin
LARKAAAFLGFPRRAIGTFSIDQRSVAGGRSTCGECPERRFIAIRGASTMADKPDPNKPFLSDVKTLRERARKHLEKGAVTSTYVGDVNKTIEILQSVLATEIVCTLRYQMHAVAAAGISSDGVKEEFATHAKEEWGHATEVAERINQLGGKPNFSPEGILSRSASEYGKQDLNLVEMIKENLVAERIAVDHYRELIRYFGNDDPTTAHMIKGILAVEEEHANDMHDLLVAHEGRPMLKE